MDTQQNAQLEDLKVKLTLQAQQFQSQMNKVQQQLSGLNTSTTNASSGVDKLDKTFSMIKWGAIAVGIAKVSQALGRLTNMGSEVIETNNLLDATFGSMSESAKAWADNALLSYGYSSKQAKETLGTYGSLAKSMGFTEQQAYSLSTGIAELTSDTASFYNLTTELASSKLKAIFTGETEALKELGVVMTLTALDQYAMNNGFGKTTVQMTEQEKVMLRYRYVQDALSDAQGDFARTSDSWSNSMKIIKASFEDIGANLGQGFISVLTPIMSTLKKIVGWLKTASEYFMVFMGLLSGKDYSSQLESSTKGASDNTNNMVSNVDNASKSATKLSKTLQGLMGFDELNLLPEKSEGSDGGSSGSGGGDVGGGALDFDTSMLDGVNDKTKLLNERLEQCKKWIDNINKLLTPLKASLKNLWEVGLKPIVGFVAQGVIDFYDKFLKPVASWTLSSALPQLADILADVLSRINWQPLNDGLSTLWSALSRFTIGLGQGLLDFLQAIAPIVGTGLNIVIQGLGLAFELLGKGMDLLPDWLIQGLGGAVAGGLTAIFTALLLMKGASMIGTILTSIGSALETLLLTCMVHPVVAIATGVGALVGAIIALSSADSSGLDEQSKRIRDNAQAYEEWLEVTNKKVDQAGGVEAVMLKALGDEYLGLRDKQNKTNEETKREAKLKRELIDKYPELKEILNDEKASTDKVRKAIDDKCKSIIKEAKLQANKDKLVELYKKESEIADDVTEAYNENEKAQKDLDSATEKYNRTLGKYTDLQKESWKITGVIPYDVAKVSDELSKCNITYGKTSKILDTATESYKKNQKEIGKTTDAIYGIEESTDNVDLSSLPKEIQKELGIGNEKAKTGSSKINKTINDAFKVNPSLGSAMVGAINGFCKDLNKEVQKSADKYIKPVKIPVGTKASQIVITPNGPQVKSANGQQYDLKSAPQLATGGVLRRGQVGILEGNGTEAVVPLEKNTQWINRVAEQFIASTCGHSSNKPLEIIVKLGETTIGREIINAIDQYTTQQGIVTIG